MAELIEDPKKKKASFGDAAAAATDGGVTQLNVGKPGDFPVNPDGTPMQKPAAGALPPAVVSTQDGGAAFGIPPSMGRRPAQSISAPGVPAGAVPLEQRVGWRTDAVMNGAAEDASAAFKKGNYGETAGALVRGAATAIPAAVIDFGEGLAGGVVPGVKGFFSGLTGGQPTPSAQAQTTVPTAAPKSAIGSGDATMPGNDQARFMAAAQSDAPLPAAPNQTAVLQSGVPPVQAGAVKTQGQMNMEADLKSAEAMKAERLAAEGRAPQAVVTHSGNDWQARNNLRNLEVSASSMTAQPKDLMAYEIARKHDTQLQGGSTAADVANVAAVNRHNEINSTAQVANARTAQQGQQFGASQELAKQRLALDNRKADIADAGAQMDNATKKQLQDLNAQILKETDPAKLAVLQEKAQTLTGKYQRPDPANRDVYGAIAGGTDAMGNKTDPIIYNKQTGERAVAQGPVATPKVDEVRGGYKFKGGNPADQKNWEKV